MKQKSKAVLIVLSVVLLLLIAGCGKKEDKKPKDFPFLGGTKGLEIGFLKDAPPDEITDGNINGKKIFPFKVVLNIKNDGEFILEKIEQVRVDLKGILPEDFGTRKQDITNQMPEGIPTPRRKDSEGNIIDPVETFVTIPKTGDLGLTRISANTEFLFRADVCYEYGTDVISKICILENMISPPDDAICNPRGEKKVFSSSSPVQIKSFRQTVAGENKIQFSFDIVHVGNGNVFRVTPPPTGSTNIPTQGCPTDLANRRAQENEVLVTVKTGIGSSGDVLGQRPSLVCVGMTNAQGESNGFVKLVNNKRTITCTQEISSRIDLERNVDIKLRFNYWDSVDKKILAKHLVEVGEPAPGVPPPTGIEPTKFRLAAKLFNDLDADGERDIVLLNPQLNENFIGLGKFLELKPTCGAERIKADLISRGKNIDALKADNNDLGGGFNLLEDIVFPEGCSEPLTMDIIVNIPQGFEIVGKDVDKVRCKKGQTGSCSLFSQVIKGGFIKIEVPVRQFVPGDGTTTPSKQIAIVMSIFNDKNADGDRDPNSADAILNEEFIKGQIVNFAPPACQTNPIPTIEQLRIESKDTGIFGAPDSNLLFQIRYPTECRDSIGKTLNSVQYIPSLKVRGAFGVGKDIGPLCLRCKSECTIGVDVENPETATTSSVVKIVNLPLIDSSKCPQ